MDSKFTENSDGRFADSPLHPAVQSFKRSRSRWLYASLPVGLDLPITWQPGTLNKQRLRHNSDTKETY